MKERGRRNNALMDPWSWAHFASGIALGWLIHPYWALLILILWEPIELFILSPLAWRWFRKEFGYETLRNSLSDIMFDAAGVAVGSFVLRELIAAPWPAIA